MHYSPFVFIEIKIFTAYNSDMAENRSTEIKENIDKLNETVHNAALKSGRDFDEIRVMAVSKTKPLDDIKAAYKAGQRLFGENRIQEAAEKFKNLPDDIKLHMIGHLQTNKAKIAAEYCVCVQSIDKLSTAAELNKRCNAIGKQVDFLIEINTSGEKSRSGYTDIGRVFADLEQYLKLSSLNLRGLMTIAPFTEDESAVRKAFKELHSYYTKLKSELPDENIDTVSMGMSSDYKIAIEEGSNLIRVGTAIFGSRNY
jgi:pyridoxal phosphate enzyme (YggS family)